MTTNICICYLQIKESGRKQEYLYSSSPKHINIAKFLAEVS